MDKSECRFFYPRPFKSNNYLFQNKFYHKTPTKFYTAINISDASKDIISKETADGSLVSLQTFIPMPISTKKSLKIETNSTYTIARFNISKKMQGKKNKNIKKIKNKQNRSNNNNNTTKKPNHYVYC